MASLRGLVKIFELIFLRPISTKLGYRVLKRISLKNDVPLWSRSFYHKNVLIVGSGPSLDEVSKNFFSKFDTIIYINHAVKLAGKTTDEYFFSTDTTVVENMQKKEYFNKIIKLGADRSILAPIHFTPLLFLDKSIVMKFSWIAARNPKYSTFKLNIPFINCFIPRLAYWPEQPNTKILETWFASPQQVLHFPVIESSSALSAILLVAKYTPFSISMIGCDFSKCRSKEIMEDNPAKDINPFSESKDKFLFIQQYLETKGITIVNLSWRQKFDN